MATTNQNQPSKLKGYNLLANLMAQYPDLSIYRRFMAARHFDLLLQEAELHQLLTEIGVAKVGDMEKPDGDLCRTFDTVFENLHSSRHDATEFSQWTRLMTARAKLKEYGDHLLQMQALQKLPSCNPDDVKTLRQWLCNDKAAWPSPATYELETWAEATEYDLTSLNGHGQHQDPLSRFLEGRVLTWVNAAVGGLREKYVTVSDPYLRAETRTLMTVYSDRTIRVVVSVLSTVLSSLLPTMSIFVLYYVERQLLRLELILVFTVLFSIVVTLVTHDKRSECFAAAAAFAAVLVVFVSGNTVDGNCASACPTR